MESIPASSTSPLSASSLSNLPRIVVISVSISALVLEEVVCSSCIIWSRWCSSRATISSSTIRESLWTFQFLNIPCGFSVIGDWAIGCSGFASSLYSQNNKCWNNFIRYTAGSTESLRFLAAGSGSWVTSWEGAGFVGSCFTSAFAGSGSLTGSAWGGAAVAGFASWKPGGLSQVVYNKIMF